MSTSYMEHLKELFCCIHEDVIKNLRNTNKEYSELIKNKIEESVKTQEILNALNAEDRAFILTSKDCTGRIEWIEKETLYFQGYKDCIKFLNILEVI